MPEKPKFDTSFDFGFNRPGAKKPKGSKAIKGGKGGKPKGGGS
jgi:hypothetical protein